MEGTLDEKKSGSCEEFCGLTVVVIVVIIGILHHNFGDVFISFLGIFFHIFLTLPISIDMVVGLYFT
jgi:hypothetical protein